MARTTRSAPSRLGVGAACALTAVLATGLLAPAASAVEPVPAASPATGTATTDTTAPTGTLSGGTTTTAPFVVRFSEPVTGVDASTVSVSPADGVLAVAADGRSATLRPATTWVAGQRYTVTVRPGITDAAGNALPAGSLTVRVGGTLDDGDRSLRYGGAWGARQASDAFGGGFRTSSPTTRTQTAVTVRLAGSVVTFTGCVGPRNGLADVWVDGTRRGRFDTYRPYSGCGVRLARLQLPAGSHRVQLRAVGLKGTDSRGTTVSVDAVTVS